MLYFSLLCCAWLNEKPTLLPMLILSQYVLSTTPVWVLSWTFEPLHVLVWTAHLLCLAVVPLICVCVSGGWGIWMHSSVAVLVRPPSVPCRCGSTVPASGGMEYLMVLNTLLSRHGLCICGQLAVLIRSLFCESDCSRCCSYQSFHDMCLIDRRLVQRETSVSQARSIGYLIW